MNLHQDNGPHRPGPAGPVLQYIGNTRAFAWYGAKQAMLCYLTLGLYIPWALIHLRQYLWRHLLIDGEPLSFSARAREQISLRPLASQAQLALAVGWYLLRSGAVFWAPRSGLQGAQCQTLACAVLLMLLSLAGYLPWGLSRGVSAFAGLRFRLHHTWWRGRRFGLTGNTFVYAMRYAGRLALAWGTCGFLYPRFAVFTRQELYSRLRFGRYRGDYTGQLQEVWPLYVRGIALCVITLGVYYPWHIATLRNYHISHLTFGDVTLSCQQDGASLSALWLGNALLSLCTLGLGLPWVTERNLRYTLTRLILTGPTPSIEESADGSIGPIYDEGNDEKGTYSGSGIADLFGATILWQ